MPADIAPLLQAPGIETFPRARAWQRRLCEIRTGLSLPTEAHGLWSRSNGFTIERPNVRLWVHPLKKCLEYHRGLKDFGIPQRWGYFPFADANDSNPFCICCRPPLRGYIVRVCHGDSADVVYRNFDSFLQALATAVESPIVAGEDGSPWFADLPGDFGAHQQNRTIDDVRIGQALLKLSGALDKETNALQWAHRGVRRMLGRILRRGSVEQGNAIRWAITLLSEDHIPEMIDLLNTGDEYCREDVLARLRSMQSPAARLAVAQHQEEYKRFIEQCAAELRRAGLQITVERETDIRLEASRSWLNMEGFFNDRRSPQFLSDFVKRAIVIASRKK
jgi:hypothetical protein